GHLYINVYDTGMRVRGTHHHRMCKVRQRKIIGVASLPAEQAPVFLAPHRLADAIRISSKHVVHALGPVTLRDKLWRITPSSDLVVVRPLRYRVTAYITHRPRVRLGRHARSGQWVAQAVLDRRDAVHADAARFGQPVYPGRGERYRQDMPLID